MEYLNSYVSDGNGNKRYFRDRSYGERNFELTIRSSVRE